MKHQSVLLSAIADYLQVKKNAWYLDATFGAGGHSREIIRLGGRVLAFEYDNESYQQALITFQQEISEQKLLLLHENFANLDKSLANQPNLPQSFAGIIFDLGTSSDQLTAGSKGLSVYQTGPLDMRLAANLAVSARDLLHGLSEKELSTLLYKLGGESYHRQIAKKIKMTIKKVGRGAFANAQELSNLIVSIKPRAKQHLHPATKTFQALRIAVNGELDNLEKALPQAWQRLLPKGRLIVMSFHEGEDRISKHFFKLQYEKGDLFNLSKKPIQSTVAEQMKNPRARSVKMRIGEKNEKNRG